MDEAVSYGESIQLNCHVSKGDKPLQLRWIVNGKTVVSGEGIKTTAVEDDTSLLTVTSADFMHSGNYTCEASNRAGKTSYSTEVFVNGT